MELMDNQNRDNSWKNDRNLLRILEQERRRRLVPPDEDELLSRNPPLFARPYKTDKEDELSRRIKRVLGDYDPKMISIYATPLDPIWSPKKPKSDSQAHSHRPASSKTNPYKDIRRESSRASLGIAPKPERNYNDRSEGLSNRRSEAKAPQSKILPELVKKKKPIDVSSTEKTLKVVEKPTSSLRPPRVCQSQDKRVAPAQRSNSESGSTRDRHSSSVSALPRAPAPEPIVRPIEGGLKEMKRPLSSLLPSLQSPVRAATYKFPVEAKAKKPSKAQLIEEILREMTSPLPPLLPPLQMRTRAETSKLPSATKESQPDGSAAQKLKQANTASETLPNSQPRTSVWQSQDKRVAPAQPSNSESGSTRDRHSSSVCGREISSSHSEEDSRPKPEPSSANKWFLGNLMAQEKQGAALIERLRKIAHGTGHEEGVKQEQGVSSGSCQQHSKARESPPKSCGQVAMDFHKTFAQEAKDSHKISGQMTKHFHKTSGQVTEAPRESHVMSTHSSLKPLVHTKEALWVSKPVGVKRPSQPLVHDKSRKVLKLESEPGPLEVRDHSSKDKLKVQEAENTELAFRSGLKLGVQKHFEKSKHKDPDKSYAHVPKAPEQSCSRVAKAPHESDVASKHSSLKPLVHTKEALWVSKPVGVKRPSQPLVHDKSSKVLKLESEPGPLEVRDHSSKDKLKVQEAENTELAFRSGLKLGVQKHFEKSKHKDPDKSYAHVPKAPEQSCSRVAKAPHESDVASKHSSLKPLVHTKEALWVSKPVGVKRPSQPLVHDKSSKVLKLESEPGPLEVRDHSSKDKLKVQEAENTELAFRSGLKLGVQKHFEKSKHKDPDKSYAHVPKAPEQSCSRVAKAPHESDVASKHSFLKPPVHTKEALLKNTLGIKRPSMSWVHDESKRVWKAEREPGLLQVTDQSCKDQPNVMETMKPKATNKKDLKPTLQEPCEKRKDEGSHQANAKGFLEPRLLRHAQECDALMLSSHRPKDLHKEKVPLPPGDKKLFLPAREADLKRKAMWSSEESPGKKKREDKEGTPRKKKK